MEEGRERREEVEVVCLEVLRNEHSDGDIKVEAEDVRSSGGEEGSVIDGERRRRRSGGGGKKRRRNRGN